MEGKREENAESRAQGAESSELRTVGRTCIGLLSAPFAEFILSGRRFFASLRMTTREGLRTCFRRKNCMATMRNDSHLCLRHCFLLSALFPLPSLPSSLNDRTVPAASTQLMERAVEAANARKSAGFEGLADDPVHTFAWVESARETWSGDILTVPSGGSGGNAAPTYLAVFHAWHTCESDGDHVHRLLKTEQGWRLGDEIAETETGGFRIRDHDLHVTLNLVQKTAAIHDRIQVERTQEPAPAFGLLRLSQDFRVRRITRLGPEGPPVPFRQAGGILAFAPPADRTFSLFLTYAGTLNHKESDYIRETEATLDSYWYPHIARLPATTTVTATAPPGWTVIAQGERLHIDRAADNSTTVTYRNDVPSSFFTLDMGRYLRTTQSSHGRTLSIYLLRSNPALAKRSLNLLDRALTFYATHFAPFPYSHYDVVETRGAFPGALEAYSFATFGPETLPDLIPHELSHTWWGGLVPCTYTHSMWNEAFAEYSDSLFQRAMERLADPGKPDPRDPVRLLRERQRMAHIFDNYSLMQARDTSDARQAAVGYVKGPLVLRVLEDLIGQETMLRCLKAFIAEHPRGEAAEWPDFAHVVHKVTGQDYNWFFAQWLERKGLPEVALAHVTVSGQGPETMVEGDILQENTPYRMRVPLLLETRNGAPIRTTVEIDGKRTHLRIKASARPVRLTLDPEGVLPFAPPSGTPETINATTYSFAE
jgi:hypothetical protein